MRLCAVVCAIALSLSATTGYAAKAKKKPKPPPLPPLEAIQGPYVVADVATGRVIEEHDALRPWFPASTTKLMTIYVAFRAIKAGEIRLDTRIGYSANALSQPPSKMAFKPGTTFTLEDALKMMMVKSANDIAIAVAEGVGASVAGFADRMNAEAKRLGMTNSHFVNPNGLPDERNYSSARDMALVARALLTEFPEYRQYYNLPAIEFGGRVLKNFNSLLERYPGATGMKTGFICSSGYNLVASAKRGDREIIAVVLGEYGGKLRTARAAELLDEGFASPPPAAGATFPTLATVTSGGGYHSPFDLREYVCGPRHVRVASDSEEESDDDDRGYQGSHLTAERIDLGPPIKVSAIVPADLGEPGFIAPLPRPRPGSESSPLGAVLNAYAPGETTGDGNSPTDAIGAAAGSAHPLGAVAPQH